MNKFRLSFVLLGLIILVMGGCDTPSSPVRLGRAHHFVPLKAGGPGPEYVVGDTVSFDLKVGAEPVHTIESFTGDEWLGADIIQNGNNIRIWGVSPKTGQYDYELVIRVPDKSGDIQRYERAFTINVVE